MLGLKMKNDIEKQMNKPRMAVNMTATEGGL